MGSEEIPKPAEERDADRASGAKPPWEKPVIRASGTFELQALACASPSAGPPMCQGQAS
jgi:hypothetical protein